MMSAFWNGFVVVLTLLSIFGCWWLLQWTKGISNREGDETGTTGHTWDEDLEELNNPLPRWWLYLFHLTIIFSLVYMVLYPGLGNFAGILGWSQEARYEQEMAAARETQGEVYAQFEGLSPAELRANQEALGIGRRLFANNCATCHGSDGRGGPGFPNLADDDWLYGGDFDTVLASIANGRSGVMPALGGALGESGVAEVVAYVESLSGEARQPELVEAGQEKFSMYCVACHGADGSGNPALGAPNLGDDIWLYGSGERIAETLNQGRNGNMPAHGDQFDEQQLRLLTAYVQSLSQH
ncbi:MAG TPA: cytochrome-c oxidase, cbb3-type subunit III [Xanthomonadales bacterium]|nr:cytochrome-c oxidase, cbb3-type subunit III [Xanthomonadales bacterium]